MKKLNSGMDARRSALQTLLAVIGEGHSLTDCFNSYSSPQQDPREHALAQALCYGVLRWLPRLDAIVEVLVKKSLKEKELEIHLILLLGLYQLLYTRIPSYAVTATSVDLTHQLGKSWASGLVNGVLRAFQRQQDELLPRIDQQAVARLAHPIWLLERFKHDWGTLWEEIASANNTHPPMTLRVNQRKTTREAYLALLQAANIAATATAHTSAGITLENPVNVQELPHFAQGWVSVQDAGAQLAVDLLNIPPSATVLDACAAPGGKIAHLLERYPDAQVLALDQHPQRLTRLAETLERLQLAAEICCADAAQLSEWWDGKLYQRILLDVPCTASGVIRRHPDIKYLRRMEDIHNFQQQQARLLETLWSVLQPQGQLLYITCSVFREENEQQLQAFLAQHPDAYELPIDATWGRPQRIGRQLLPCDFPFDGFYYARLCKQA